MRLIASALLIATFSLLAAPASAAPLRTLVYHFEMDARGFGANAIAGSSPTGGAVMSEGTDMGSVSRSGKIKAEVIQAASDGGLVVDVTESVDRTDRDMQTVRCAIYGRTLTVICDQNLFTTEEETVLLTYLGRAFLNMDALDDKKHWHVVTPMSNVHIDSDFTITKTDGDLLTMSLQKKERGGPSGETEDTSGTMIYNGALNVPQAIKLATERAADGSNGDMNMKLDLLTDSMNKTPVAH